MIKELNMQQRRNYVTDRYTFIEDLQLLLRTAGLLRITLSDLKLRMFSAAR
jgi:hypothetical protein